jgi:Domain of unknown function (DUF5666)
MSRKLAVALLALAFSASLAAKGRSVAPPPQDDPARISLGSGASVTGEVSSVNGGLILLAGGIVTIDASGATFLNAEGKNSIESIKPGMLIAATLREPSSVSTAPLVATAVAVLRSAEVTLTGTVQSVDTAGGQFLLLNKTIRTNAATTFVNANGLSNIQANTMVVVEANASGNALVASRVTLIAAIPPRPQTSTGVVKSIGSNAWVITVRDRDTTFVINSSTKILGDPKAGDKVEVLYTVDTANANVALAIVKHIVIEVPKIVRFSGVVKSIEAHYWVITRDDDKKDVIVRWPENVRLFPAVRVGDHVDVVASENGDGSYKLITILPRR